MGGSPSSRTGRATAARDLVLAERPHAPIEIVDRPELAEALPLRSANAWRRRHRLAFGGPLTSEAILARRVTLLLKTTPTPP
jgi:hypothetical protein